MLGKSRAASCNKLAISYQSKKHVQPYYLLHMSHMWQPYIFDILAHACLHPDPTTAPHINMSAHEATALKGYFLSRPKAKPEGLK